MGWALATTPARAADSPRDHSGWWLQNYKPLDTSKPLPRRAAEIFARVSAAADKSGNRLPRLVQIDAAGEPWALALPDGSIVLTRGALRLTLEAGDRHDAAAGDARLAFVLGHELAHLAKDDFWHASAFSAVTRFSREATRQTTLGLLRTTPRDLQSAELQADAYGLLYMTWAGYAPETLLAQEASFFDQWSVATGEVGDLAHPGASDRGAFLRSQLAQVADDLDFFRFGVRLLELGRYEDALLLLERFKDLFASREVFTDIGVAHYQLALRELARCDGQAVMRFALPLIADPATLAERRRQRGAAGSSPALLDPCLDAPAFREQIATAQRYLRLACERDGQYLPARVDLLAAMLLDGKYAGALELADEALELAPRSSEALNGKALGLFQFGLDTRTDTTDTALALLDEARRADPSSSAPIYNQAVILDQRGRTAAARAAWVALLALEPNGPYSESARHRLTLPSPPVARGTANPPSSPLAIGAITPATAERLRALARHDFVLGDFRGAFLRAGDAGAPGALSALVIGGVLELVESVPGEPVARGTAEQRYGPPLRTLSTARGVVLIYPNFALEFSGSTLLATIHFASPSA